MATKGSKTKTAKVAKEATVKRTRGAYWDSALMEKAAAARNYIKLGEKGGNLLLSGAAQKWKSSPTFTYVPSLRVAGEPSDIFRVMRAMLDADTSDADIRAHISAGYTAANQGAAYQAELEDLKAYKASNKPAAGKAVGLQMKKDISYYAENIDDATLETRSGGSPTRKRASSPKRKSPKAKAAKKTTKATKSRSKSATRSKSKSPKARKSPAKRGAKPLAEKLEKLSEGKVMDISKYRASTKEAKSMNMPGGKSKKFLIPGTRLVSDDLAGVKAAAKDLGDESLVQRWKDAKAAGPAAPAEQLPLSPAVTSPLGVPRASSPSSTLPGLPVRRIGSAKTSPRV